MPIQFHHQNQRMDIQKMKWSFRKSQNTGKILQVVSEANCKVTKYETFNVE